MKYKSWLMFMVEFFVNWRFLVNWKTRLAFQLTESRWKWIDWANGHHLSYCLPLKVAFAPTPMPIKSIRFRVLTLSRSSHDAYLLRNDGFFSHQILCNDGILLLRCTWLLISLATFCLQNITTPSHFQPFTESFPRPLQKRMTTAFCILLSSLNAGLVATIFLYITE